MSLPVVLRSNCQLVNRFHAILRMFDRSCDEWDWPLVRVVFPREVSELVEIQAEARKRDLVGEWIVV